MVDPFTGLGLASSIVTIAEVGYKISKRTVEFSRLLGGLPPDLQSCKDLVDIVVRTGERLQRRIPRGDGGGTMLGPPTELQTDAASLLDLLDTFEGPGALSKALRLARKEGKIAQIRNRLDQHVLAILFVLEENQNVSDVEIRNIAIDVKKEFHRLHDDIVSQISTCFQQVETLVQGSNDSLLEEIRPLLSARDQEFESLRLRLLGGQQHLSQNLERIERNFCSALRTGEKSVAAQIQDQTSGQQVATRTLFDSMSQGQDAMHSNFKHLLEEVTTHLGRLEQIRKVSSKSTRTPLFQIEASFEVIHLSEPLASHVRHGIDWAFKLRNNLGIECIPLDIMLRRVLLIFVTERQLNQYRLITFNILEERY